MYIYRKYVCFCETELHLDKFFANVDPPKRGGTVSAADLGTLGSQADHPWSYPYV
jgi:hypothetical protein